MELFALTSSEQGLEIKSVASVLELLVYVELLDFNPNKTLTRWEPLYEYSI